MMNNSLAKILNTESTLGSSLFIHVSNDDYPLADFILQQLKSKLGNYHKQTFTADKSFNLSVVEDIITNVSLFEQPNYIQINFKTKPNAAWQKQLTELMGKLNDNNFLVIVCDKLNKTDQNTKWFKEISSTATTLGISNFDAEFLISHLLNEHNLKISRDALNTLITQNQGNFSQLLNEANKLTLAIPAGHTIEVGEIAKLTTDNAEYNVYQLSTSYLSGNLAKSIKILDNLYQDSGDAILIMWMLQEDVKKLLKIKSRLKTTTHINQVIKEMYIWGESAINLPLANQRVGYNTLVDIYQDLAQLDMSIKGVMSFDVKLLLTQIIKKMCGPA